MGPHLGCDPKRVSTRRNFLFVAGAVGLIAGWRAAAPTVADLFAGELEFSPIKGLDGYRRIGGGTISSAPLDPFLGLDEAPVKHVRLKGSLAKNLHYAAHSDTGAAVPVAEFTDYNCPYCKVLAERVHALEDAGKITLSLHHLPLLGANSLEAARVALAVDDPAFHRRLMASRLRVNAEYALQIARDQSRDIAAIQAQIGKNDAHIARARALANRFGIIGTPALVVGRTLVIGQISERRLARLIEAERSSI